MVNNNNCHICGNGSKANTPCIGGVCKQKSCKSCVNKWRKKQRNNNNSRIIENKKTLGQTCAHCRAPNIKYPKVGWTILSRDGRLLLNATVRLDGISHPPSLRVAVQRAISVHEQWLSSAIAAGAISWERARYELKRTARRARKRELARLKMPSSVRPDLQSPVVIEGVLMFANGPGSSGGLAIARGHLSPRGAPLPRQMHTGGLVRKTAPHRLLKDEIVLSRAQRKGLTHGQIVKILKAYKKSK